MVPPPLHPNEAPPVYRPAHAAPNQWVRGVLVGMVLGLSAVFAIAVWLDPYDEDGQPRRMETHRQLGLPPCTFYSMTGVPCPSCGMTTSFALLVRGDVLNSLRANAVGTALAAFCLFLIPWGLASAVRGRLYFIRSLERALTRVILIFLALLLVRWAFVVGAAWLGGKDIHFRFPLEPYRSHGRALREERRWQHPGTPGVWRPSS
jgi:Protein of unknown function (DUF2752)